MSRRKVILLGDSILDNRPYTAPAPDTADHLRHILGDGWSVELLARDGATMSDMPRQLRQVSDMAATAFVSVGGNDVTRHIGLLARSGTDAPAVLGELLGIAERFAASYEEVARSVAARVERTVLCTIYEVQLEPPPFADLARIPLAVLNDRIIRTAARSGLEVLELRDVCTAPSDFVMQIEPSAEGARKIASSVAAVLRAEPVVRTALVHSAA
jgi:lysophospholipase L1-like esterase